MTRKVEKKTHTGEIEKYFKTLNEKERFRAKKALQYIHNTQYGSDMNGEKIKKTCR